MNDVIRLITNENELDAAQAEMARLLEITDRTPDDENRLGTLVTLIRAYEDVHWALDLPDPIFAIQSRMNDLELRQTDLLKEFGDKATASLIMNRKRFLTLPIIRRLSSRLSIPVAILIQEYALSPGGETQDARQSATG